MKFIVRTADDDDCLLFGAVRSNYRPKEGEAEVPDDLAEAINDDYPDDVTKVGEFLRIDRLDFRYEELNALLPPRDPILDGLDRDALVLARDVRERIRQICMLRKRPGDHLTRRVEYMRKKFLEVMGKGLDRRI